MNVLAEKEGRTYVAMGINAPGDFANPFPDILFPCMIWDHNGRLTEPQRTEVAKRLLQAGCRYAVCGGENSEAWHDSVDEEVVRQHADGPNEARNAVHVMTTSHAAESVDDVAFFFALNTNFDDHRFERHLVLHIGDGPAKEEVDTAVRRYALDREAV